jgi:hypothetical protein
MALKNCQASKKRNTVFAEKADESAYTRGHDGGKAACHFFGGFANVTGATGAAWDGMASFSAKAGRGYIRFPPYFSQRENIDRPHGVSYGKVVRRQTS